MQIEEPQRAMFLDAGEPPSLLSLHRSLHLLITHRHSSLFTALFIFWLLTVTHLFTIWFFGSLLRCRFSILSTPFVAIFGTHPLVTASSVHSSILASSVNSSDVASFVASSIHFSVVDSSVHSSVVTTSLSATQNAGGSQLEDELVGSGPCHLLVYVRHESDIPSSSLPHPERFVNRREAASIHDNTTPYVAVVHTPTPEARHLGSAHACNPEPPARLCTVASLPISHGSSPNSRSFLRLLPIGSLDTSYELAVQI
ncbi:hypothetical protein F2Q69_00049439 [Brassica cretica]|uniref:Uncharacterized protein n=1 Tax=Brassica cretica TaxID=69181 RepID=A0A8S9PGR1_BRACR|nr:hypothetical protein F2Q69_00049439 [Brassica cretica]